MRNTSDDPARFRHLFTKSQLEGNFQAGLEGGWRFDAYHQFCEHVLDPTFPCFFATKAQKNGWLKYCFTDLTSSPNLTEFCEAVAEFIEYVQILPEPEQLYEVLIAFFKTPDTTLREHHARAWTILQQMMDQDTIDWPKDVARDPEDPAWSFSFHATPLFVNINSGFHEQRRSRNLGADLVLVMQFREGFDHLPGDPVKLREIIRARIDRYDVCQRSPFLGTYGRPESREYLQYALQESNNESAGRCPLMAKAGNQK